jgi:membrane protein implicated in regulation of membrane protease activity
MEEIIMLNINMVIIWTILIILFIVIEGFTLGLTAIWFAAGSIFALLFASFNFSVISQFIIFVISSGLLLFFTKSFVAKYLKVGENKTNIDSIIGKKGEVKERITKFEIGLVKVDGQMWSAISSEDKEINLNEEVVVISVEGVKLIVKRSE